MIRRLLLASLGAFFVSALASLLSLNPILNGRTSTVVRRR